MNMIDRLDNTLKFTPRMGSGTNSVARMQALYRYWGVTISKRTIVRDFTRLELAGRVEFVKYSGAAKLFSKPKIKEASFSPQLAWALTKLKKNIEQLCTAELMSQIEAELTAAEDLFNENLRLDPQSKFNRFTLKLAPVTSFLARSKMPNHIIDPIKEALFDDRIALSITQSNLSADQSINQISLKLIDEKVYLCGNLTNDSRTTLSMSLDNIKSIELSKKMPFQQSQPAPKAA